MKPISKTTALSILDRIRKEFRAEVSEKYEHKAAACSECPTPGICCRDEHFVNVRISRLEAEDIARRLAEIEASRHEGIFARIADAVGRYGLDGPDASERTYACPLFEPGTGCIVHSTAKPLPCIFHACYERQEDLPPDNLLEEREQEVSRLNRRVYGVETMLTPLPVGLLSLIDGMGHPRPTSGRANVHREPSSERAVPER
jgi:hypothetical protein